MHPALKPISDFGRRYAFAKVYKNTISAVFLTFNIIVFHVYYITHSFNSNKCEVSDVTV